MKRKKKVWYEIGIDEPSQYWYGGGKWFIPQYDEDGKGLNNPAHSNWQFCRTKKQAIKAALKAKYVTGQPVLMIQKYMVKGIRYKREYFLN